MIPVRVARKEDRVLLMYRTRENAIAVEFKFNGRGTTYTDMYVPVAVIDIPHEFLEFYATLPFASYIEAEAFFRSIDKIIALDPKEGDNEMLETMYNLIVDTFIRGNVDVYEFKSLVERYDATKEESAPKARKTSKAKKDS